MREAQRKAEQEARRAAAAYNRDVDRINRHNQQVVREINRHNQQVAAYNRQVDARNRAADRNNKRVIADLNRALRSASSPVQYTPEEQQLADRVQEAIALQDMREYHVYLSYAHIDGSAVAAELKEELEALDVAVWFDEVAIQPGRSQALQMDRGLRAARSGVAVLTPAYLAGRFWTERELGALLHKPTLIPVLHGVTWEDVGKHSGILPDLAGFSTDRDPVPVIAGKIAAAVVLGEAA